MDLTLPDQLENQARHGVRVSGTRAGIRQWLNLLPAASTVTITATDDPADEEVEVTIGVSLSALATAQAGHGLDANGDVLDVDETELVNFTQANLTSGLRFHHVANSEPTLSNGDLWYDTDDNRLYVENSSGHTVCITPVSAEVATSETTTSSSYVDLATPGPAVSVLTGTKAIVTCRAFFTTSAASITRMGFAVSGATTLAAQNVLLLQDGAAQNMIVSSQMYVTGLTAGVNTFTAKYQISAGTGTYALRQITAVGVP